MTTQRVSTVNALTASPRVKLRAAAILLISGFLTACTMHQASVAPTTLRNKITVAETVERLEVYTQPGGLSLSARDEDAVSDFIQQYGRYGQGPLYINVPSGAANGLGVQQAQTAINMRLRGMGLPGSVVQAGQYPSHPNAPAPLVVSFRRLTTAPIDCQQGASLTHTSNNQAYGNFGCSQTANLAAMIDDPRQLLAPYAEMPVQAYRGVGVLETYQAREATGTARPDGQEITAGGN